MGREPKRLKATTAGVSVNRYLQILDESLWQQLAVRNTAKGVLVGEYHLDSLASIVVCTNGYSC